MELIVNIKAGLPERMTFGGIYLAVLDVTGAASFALSVRAGGQVIEELSTARRGLSLEATQRFDAVEFASPVDCAVRLVVSDGRVRIGAIDGATVNVVATSPLPVANDRGTPGNLLHVTGVSLADAPATAATAVGPVACGPTAVQVVAASAARRAVRFVNLGPDPVAIVPVGGTWAQRVQVLQVDDVWVEDRAANLAWAGVTDAGKTASVNAMQVTA
jgi:hypothetical protein